jgi:F0F1-type ATP synthase delta subunit
MYRATRINRAASVLAEKVLTQRFPKQAVDVLFKESKSLNHVVRKVFLRAVFNAVYRRVLLSKYIVEYAGSLTDEDRNLLEQTFFDEIRSGLVPEFKKNDSLLAGIRVQMRDHRWEYSLRETINKFLLG